MPEYSCCQMRLPTLEPSFLTGDCVTAVDPDVPVAPFVPFAEPDDPDVPDVPLPAESPAWSNRTTPRCLSKLAFLIVTVALLAFRPCSFATDASMVTV